MTLAEASTLADKFSALEASGGDEALLNTLQRMKNQFVQLHQEIKVGSPDGNNKAQRTMHTQQGLLQALKERVQTQNKVRVLSRK